MILKQYYLGCLAHASYLVGDQDDGVAAVVDPQRDAYHSSRRTSHRRALVYADARRRHAAVGRRASGRARDPRHSPESISILCISC